MNSYIVINFLKTGKIRTSADEEDVIAVLLGTWGIKVIITTTSNSINGCTNMILYRPG